MPRDSTADDVEPVGASPPAGAPGGPRTSSPLTNPPPAFPEKQALGRAPDFHGTLAETPIPHLLVHALARGLTGSLVLRAPEGAHDVVVFEDAAPTRVGTDTPIASLGELLVELGYFPADRIQGAMARARAWQRTLGQQLVEERRLDPEALVHAMNAQVMRRLGSIAGDPRLREYEFYVGVDLLADNARHAKSIACDPLAALLHVVRAWGSHSGNDRAIEATLARLGAHALALHPESNIERFALTPDERAVAHALAMSPRSMQDIVDARIAPASVARALVYTLYVAHQLDLGAGSGGPLGGSGVVAPAASTAPSLAPPSAQRISARPPPAPAAGPASVPPPEPEPEVDPASKAEALEQFHRAEAFLRDDQPAKAERAASLAVQRDPNRPEYLALLAWLRSMHREPAARQEALELLDMALARSPNEARALVYRGTLLRREGRTGDAQRDFQAALRVDPNNEEALRQLRASDRPPGATPSRAPAKGGANAGASSKQLRAALAVALLVSLGAAAFVLLRPSLPMIGPDAEVRRHLLSTALAFDDRAKIEDDYAALDAKGRPAATAAASLLTDPTPATLGDSRSSLSMQRLAHRYLMHVSQHAKAPAPRLALEVASDDDFGRMIPPERWLSVQEAWRAWLAATP